MLQRINRCLAVAMNTLTWVAMTIVLLPALMEGGNVFSAIAWIALLAIPLSLAGAWVITDRRGYLVKYQGLTAILALGCHLGVASVFFQAQLPAPGIFALIIAALTFLGWPYPTFGSTYDRYVQWWFREWNNIQNRRAKGWDLQ